MKKSAEKYAQITRSVYKISVWLNMANCIPRAIVGPALLYGVKILVAKKTEGN